MIIEVMKQIAELKKRFLAGNLTKQEVATQFTLLLHKHGMIPPDAVVEIEELPEAFWLPCDCVFCRAERGEGPLPLDAVVEVESLRASYQFGLISKVEAMLKIEIIFRKYNVTQKQAVEFWRFPQQHQCPGVSPLKPEEKEFFASLEEQMKIIPKEGENE